MKTRAIGSLQVSVVGLGCNNFGRTLDGAETRVVVDAALEAGINFFDTADAYGREQSEVYLGQALGTRRKSVLIATKFGWQLDAQRGGARPAYIKRAVEDSLRRLGTDYIDLYQLHRPDPSVPIADTLGALNELVCAGKVREIGCSNFSAAQVRATDAAAMPEAAHWVSVQNEYSLLVREVEREVLPVLEVRGISLLPYFPLASGLLTGKYVRGAQPPQGARLSDPNYRGTARFLSEQTMARAEALRSFAEQRGHTLIELAVSWLLSRRVVASVIAGATRAEQVVANVAATCWHLQPEELAEIDLIAPLDPAATRAWL